MLFAERSGSAAVLRNKNELNQLSDRLLRELLVKLGRLNVSRRVQIQKGRIAFAAMNHRFEERRIGDNELPKGCQ